MHPISSTIFVSALAVLVHGLTIESQFVQIRGGEGENNVVLKSEGQDSAERAPVKIEVKSEGQESEWEEESEEFVQLIPLRPEGQESCPVKPIALHLEGQESESEGQESGESSDGPHVSAKRVREEESADAEQPAAQHRRVSLGHGIEATETDEPGMPSIQLSSMSMFNHYFVFQV